MTIRRRSRRRRGPNKPADERKDYLIQARVPRDLDTVLKQDAKRRRLSVSHLIRNVLQDTYELVDGVIGEVDQIVQDSVALTGRVTRDAKQIARSAAGLRERAGAGRDHEAHEPARAATSPERQREAQDSQRQPDAAAPERGRAQRDSAGHRDVVSREGRDDRGAASSAQRGEGRDSVRDRGAASSAQRGEGRDSVRDRGAGSGRRREPDSRDRARASKRSEADFEARTADVYAWQSVVLNRVARCERCGRDLDRGETAHLGLSQTPTTAPRWLCPSCLALLSDR